MTRSIYDMNAHWHLFYIVLKNQTRLSAVFVAFISVRNVSDIFSDDSPVAESRDDKVERFDYLSLMSCWQRKSGS